MRIDEALKRATKELAHVSKRPLFEAEILLAHLLNQERVYLHLHFDKELDEAQAFFALVARRANFEPIEYITQEVSFYSNIFKIKKGILIPRPETEELLKHAIPYIKGFDNIVEVGTGSGIISIMLAKLLRKKNLIACDINKEAIELAKENALRHNVSKNIQFIQSDILERIYTSIDVLISNPPYIANNFELEENVLFEPKEALFGGERGDEFLKRLIDVAIERDVKILACEMGYDQKEYIQHYCESKNVEIVRFYRDLNNLDRGFIARINAWNNQ